MSGSNRFGTGVLTPIEFARGAGLPVQRVYALMRNGTLPVYREDGYPPLIPTAAAFFWLSGQPVPKTGYVINIVRSI